MKQFTTRACLVALMASGIGCEGSEFPVNVPPPVTFDNNLEVIQADSDLSTFLELATLAGFVDKDPETGEIIGGTLATAGVSILAPTNAAFTAADADTLAFLQENPRKLSRVLRSHMMSGGLQPQLLMRVPEEATVATNSVTTELVDLVTDLDGNQIFIQTSEANLLFNYTTEDETLLVAYNDGENAVEPDIEVADTVTKTENGFVYSVNEVIVADLPPINTAHEIYELGRDNFTSFASSVRANMREDEALTVIVPSEEYLSTPSDDNSIAPVALDPFIRETIAKAHTFAGKISTATVTESISGVAATFAGNEGALTIDGVALSEATDGGNGNIYFIDGPFYVPPTAREVAQEAGLTDLLGVVDGLPESDQAWVLDRDPLSKSFKGIITVFAPTNEAIAGVGAVTDVQALNVVAAHVVEGAVLAEDLTDGAELETIQGTTLTVKVADDGAISLVTYTAGENEDDDPVEVGRVSVSTTTDIRTFQGVVHVIEDVISVDPAQPVVPLGGLTSAHRLRVARDD